jgi:hypothetical protein
LGINIRASSVFSVPRVVDKSLIKIHHRATENTEDAQRKPN